MSRGQTLENTNPEKYITKIQKNALCALLIPFGNCPGNVLDISVTHPRHFWECSGKCPGKFPGQLRDCRGNVQETSGNYSRNFLEMSGKKSGKFPGMFLDSSRECSWQCPRRFPGMSWNVPGHVSEISHNFPGSVPEMSWKFPRNFLNMSPETAATCLMVNLLHGGAETL